MSGQSKKCEVFIVSDIVKHPNADTLSIIRFYNYECVVKTDSFKPGDKAVYIPPDSIVPLEKPEFSFLAKMKKTGRIKSQKLRGVQSTGLVIPAPKGYNVGDDVSEYYGITHYSAPEIETVGEVREQSFLRRMKKLAVSPFYKNYGKVKIPKYQGPYYDIESWFRYDSLFTEGEPVIVTEKIHGMNARYTYQDGKFHCCSRKFWRKDTDGYWSILKQNKWLQRLCKRNPNFIVYGEIYGIGIQKEINYGCAPQFRVFDIYDPIIGKWLTWDHMTRLIFDSFIESKWEKIINWLFGAQEEIKYYPVVPKLYTGPYDKEKISGLISGETFVNSSVDEIREGIVIKPVLERTDPRFGRVILKAVSPEYLER